MSDIYYPSSNAEIHNLINDGYAVCNKCGALMDNEYRDGIGVYICPACGWEIDEVDYEYEEEDEFEWVVDDRGKDILIPKMDMPPAGCRACGGPYPHCKSNCREYND